MIFSYLKVTTLIPNHPQDPFVIIVGADLSPNQLIMYITSIGLASALIVVINPNCPSPGNMKETSKYNDKVG